MLAMAEVGLHNCLMTPETHIDIISEKLMLETGYLTEAMRPLFALQIEAEKIVRQEHPHWFIHYASANLQRRHAQKIASRQRKAQFAIQAKISELSEERGIDVDTREVAKEALGKVAVIRFGADAEAEVAFLEEIHELPSTDLDR